MFKNRHYCLFSYELAQQARHFGKCIENWKVRQAWLDNGRASEELGDGGINRENTGCYGAVTEVGYSNALSHLPTSFSFSSSVWPLYLKI